MKPILMIFIVLTQWIWVSGQTRPIPHKEYTAIDRYNDSLLIYNTYKHQIEDLKQLKPVEFAHWYEREVNDDTLTVCAIVRLSRYNKQHYDPIKEYNREGVGYAVAYPAPGILIHIGAFVSQQHQYRYSIIDEQTHFMCDSAGKTVIPYITRTYYDKGRVLSIEKLNPITYEIIQDQPSKE
jgi:hypothetical protein